MGVDQSKLKGLQIEKNAVESNDFWILYNAEIPNDDSSTLLSIFQEESFVKGQLWICEAPLKRAIKNLMIYRHPIILRYITSWEEGSRKYLATERSLPLSLVIQSQTDLQICLGLKNILSSLIFLVEQAKARHLNICMSSIFVNADGEWRLGGFEFVWKTNEITKKLLDLTKSYRYKNSVDPKETVTDGGSDNCIEQYAFAVFCEELLKNRKNSDTPYVQEFCDYCSTHLKHQNLTMRPKLSAILLHPYFNHEFILIHSFLSELPLKGPREKQDFFTGLIDRLRYFDEAVVAAQIGNLLLSRMVLLDVTAQLCVTPYILKTKSEVTSPALFSHKTYVKYIIPRIKQIFCVRDAQIRLILLEYFNEYIKLLTRDELKEQILPNLLLGIKDTNDILVAKTLRCLADLVPILGSKIVISTNNRKRLFADGRPQGLPDCTSHWIEPRSITPVITTNNCGNAEYCVSGSPLPQLTIDNNDTISESFISVTSTTTNANNLLIMPERLSPDGGEDIQTAATDGDLEEDEAWSDWENDERQHQLPSVPSINIDSSELQQQQSVPSESSVEHQKLNHNDQKHSSTITAITSAVEQSKSPAKVVIDDINELDIKNQKFKVVRNSEEIDFFKDMEPIIQTSKILTTATANTTNVQQENFSSNDKNLDDPIIEIDTNRFAFKLDYTEDDNLLSSVTTGTGGWDCDGEWD